MKLYSLFLAFMLLYSCGKSSRTDKKEITSFVKKDTTNKEQTNLLNNSKINTNENSNKGFLFVDIGKIYFKGGYLNILKNNKKDTIITFDNKRTYFGGKKYESIEESGFYDKLIKVIAFDPEYSLFILECLGSSNGYYEVKINGEIGFIDYNKYNQYLELKTPERYVLDSYPLLKKTTPLRIEPNENAKVIENFLNYTYISVKIEGDWLKVKDDKECFIDEPSKEDIIGWVRWRKDGEIIIELAYSC